MSGPYASAFDGQRVLITSITGQSVSLWKAADLTAIGSFGIGRASNGACSDGVNFWLTVTNGLVRF